MSNIVNLSANQYDIDSNSNVISQIDWINQKSYSFKESLSFTTPDTSSSPAYVAINFGPIATGKFIRLQSDQVLNIKLNGGSEIRSNVSLFVMSGDITAVSIENISGNTATVSIEIYGE